MTFTDKPGIVKYMELKTFVQWNERGRTVKKGEHAEKYAVKPGSSYRLALFREDQTEPAIAPDWESWDIVDAADLPPKKKPDKRPIMRYKYENGRAYVYVNTGFGRDAMKKNGFRWHPPTGRWHRDASAAQVAAMVALFTREGYRIIDETSEEITF